VGTRTVLYVLPLKGFESQTTKPVTYSLHRLHDSDSRRKITYTYIKVKVNWSHYRPGVAQRVGRGIALLFHDRGTRRWVSGQQHVPTALYPRERPGTHFTGGWVGPRAGLDRCGKSRPHRVSIPDRPARSQSLYRLSYRAHTHTHIYIYTFSK